jgi:hypothetical protein
MRKKVEFTNLTFRPSFDKIRQAFPIGSAEEKAREKNFVEN